MYTVHKQQLIGWTGFRQKHQFYYLYIYIYLCACLFFAETTVHWEQLSFDYSERSGAVPRFLNIITKKALITECQISLSGSRRSTQT